MLFVRDENRNYLPKVDQTARCLKTDGNVYTSSMDAKGEIKTTTWIEQAAAGQKSERLDDMTRHGPRVQKTRPLNES
jgi:hypothetical protein